MYVVPQDPIFDQMIASSEFGRIQSTRLLVSGQDEPVVSTICHGGAIYDPTTLAKRRVAVTRGVLGVRSAVVLPPGQLEFLSVPPGSYVQMLPVGPVMWEQRAVITPQLEKVPCGCSHRTETKTLGRASSDAAERTRQRWCERPEPFIGSSMSV